MIHLLLLAIEVLTFVNKKPSVTSFGLKKLRASILKELDRNDYSTPDNNSKGLIIDNKCGLVNNEGVCYFNSVIQSLFCNKSFVLFYIMNDFVDKQVLSKTVQHLAYRMITRSNINPRPYILQLQNHPRLVNHCTTNGGNPLILLEELLMGLYAEIEDEDDLVFTDGSPDKFFIKESHLTTCKKCTKKNEEDVYSVTMRIPFSNTIEESLDFYHNIKNSKVENKYYKCLECKIFTPAVISETKHDVSYPDNLIVVFERVQVKNNVIYSIFQEIEFNKTMTIGGQKYEVYAAICSYMLRKGYHANAIGRKNDRWVLFNDNQLEVFPPNYIDNDIFNNYAWIIFYQKIK